MKTDISRRDPTITIEEKIDLMLEGKSRLSHEIIQSSSEAWITEMGNRELLELFSLAL